ncbi:MAG: HNH endonuclease signature motif containing protein, partial [Candidatus Paceibacterota bacterium]
MNNQTLNIDRLINSVGTETFIKYFTKFATSDRDELIALFEENSEPWKESSKGQKASNGIRIFKENLEIEALEHIILKKKESKIPNGSWVKKRAKELYIDHSPTSEIQSESVKLSRTEREILVKYRLQQGKFRKNLILYWEGCSITDCKNSALLIASHIKPYSESNDKEKYDTNNGLLLTPTFDK